MHTYIYTHSQILIDEFPGDGVKAISRLQYQCANMNYADKSRYNIMFQKVVQKGVDSAINYNKMFQNAKALKISVKNRYTEDHLMHNFLDNFQKGVKYSAQIANHQVELRR